MKHLKGFRFWADECVRTGYEPDPTTFGENDIEIYTEKYAEVLTRMKADKDYKSAI
jgi:hypothetical protein